VYGIIRWCGNLDWIIAQFIKSAKLKNLEPEILEILRLGLYQIFYMNSVPNYAAVNESVNLAKAYGNPGASGLVNAILRRAIRDEINYPNLQKNPLKHISARYSHPEWMVKRWIDRYGIDGTIHLCSANNLRPPLYVRTNLLKTSREELIDILTKEGVLASISHNLPESIEIANLGSSIDDLPSYRRGLFQVQDESSMLVTHILDPKPNETIIDACSAPGGKSTHIAEFMQNAGKILSYDIDGQKLDLLKENCQRLGITIIKAIEADARQIECIEKADRILVDVPCSGLGVLRRRVEARWRRSLEQIQEFSKLQYNILDSVSNYVKPNGVLVYSTCTIEPEENQQVIEKFLKLHPEFRIQTAYAFLTDELMQVEDIITDEGYLQTYPHLHKMDGFFAVRMIKKVVEDLGSSV
jgi:16S rRNA (cytosine967-C5)-methyltransferase